MKKDILKIIIGVVAGLVIGCIIFGMSFITIDVLEIASGDLNNVIAWVWSIAFAIAIGFMSAFGLVRILTMF